MRRTKVKTTCCVLIFTWTNVIELGEDPVAHPTNEKEKNKESCSTCKNSSVQLFASPLHFMFLSLSLSLLKQWQVFKRSSCIRICQHWLVIPGGKSKHRSNKFSKQKKNNGNGNITNPDCSLWTTCFSSTKTFSDSIETDVSRTHRWSAARALLISLNSPSISTQTHERAMNSTVFFEARDTRFHLTEM